MSTEGAPTRGLDSVTLDVNEGNHSLENVPEPAFDNSTVTEHNFKELQGLLSAEPTPEREGSVPGSDAELGDVTEDDNDDSRIESLYNAYHTSYAVPINETSPHMQYAKDLASALLQRHFPESEGYLVEPAALGPYSANGINFLLNEINEPDADPDVRSRKPSRDRKTHVQYSFRSDWHFIAPEYMAAFEVKKSTAEVVEDDEVITFRTHTYLVVIIDDLLTFPRWSRANVNHRGDVLSDLLGVRGGIAKGRGMLFFGPRLELYSYDANDASEPVKRLPQSDWRTDMRTTSLAAVDSILRGFAGHQVSYQDAS